METAKKEPAGGLKKRGEDRHPLPGKEQFVLEGNKLCVYQLIEMFHEITDIIGNSCQFGRHGGGLF